MFSKCPRVRTSPVWKDLMTPYVIKPAIGSKDPLRPVRDTCGKHDDCGDDLIRPIYAYDDHDCQYQSLLVAMVNLYI
jgi:hypothetical protein